MTSYTIRLPEGSRKEFHTFQAATWEEAVVIARNWGVAEGDIQGGSGAPSPAPTPTPSPTPTTTQPTAPGYGLGGGYVLPTDLPKGMTPPTIDIGPWTTRPSTEESAARAAHGLAEWQEFEAYVKFLREGGIEQGYPVPRDIVDYFSIKSQIERGEPVTPGARVSDVLPPVPEWGQEAPPPEEVPPTEYPAAEREYREAPMYQPTFTQWIQGRGDMSGALQQYIEGRYPSLKAEFQAGAGRLPYSETREGAIGEAGQRERGFQAWLGERMPETRQEYWGQRPQERGERMYMYQPTLRSANW